PTTRYHGLANRRLTRLAAARAGRMLTVFCRGCQRLHGRPAAHSPNQKRHLVLAEAGLPAARSNRFLDVPGKGHGNRPVADSCFESRSPGGGTVGRGGDNAARAWPDGGPSAGSSAAAATTSSADLACFAHRRA